MCDNVSVISDIQQLDGNNSIISDNSNNIRCMPRGGPGHIEPVNRHRLKNAMIANHLPVITVCNMRSFFPKIKNFKEDFLNHAVDVSLLCEVWEKKESKRHKAELEEMLEMEGLKYFSTTRPRGKRGGGAAIIVNTEKFHVEKLNIQIPNHLEIIWALAKPKAETALFKRIILCSFYSPPRSRLRNKLKDHITGTLQLLTTKYENCAIFVGGDKNKMDITSVLNSNLKLKQVVQLFTRKRQILDVLITNMFSYYNSPVIIPPVQPDIPGQGVPSDHSVPLCVPHTDPHHPPTREYKTVVSRPMPESKIREFGQWVTSECWMEVIEENNPSQQVKLFEGFIEEKLNHFFPQKVSKIGVGDKPYSTSETKALKRKRMNEYKKKGKTEKYYRLKDELEIKLKKSAENFLKKNMESLKETNPSKVYSKSGSPARGV